MEGNRKRGQGSSWTVAAVEEEEEEEEEEGDLAYTNNTVQRQF
jgi:hypothetical protein